MAYQNLFVRFADVLYVLRGKVCGPGDFLVSKAVAEAKPENFTVLWVMDVFGDRAAHVGVTVYRHKKPSKIKNAATLPGMV